jgi:hypothetical protein
MKSFKLAFCFTVVLISLIAACSKDGGETPVENSPAEQIINTATESGGESNTDLGLVSNNDQITDLTEMTRLVGIDTLTRTALTENSVTYRLSGVGLMLNDFFENYNDYLFSYEILDTVLSLVKLEKADKTTTLILNSSTRTIYHVESNTTISNEFLEENHSYHNPISVAGVLYNEIKNPNLERFPKEASKVRPPWEDGEPGIRPCYRTALSTRTSRSRVIEAINDYVDRLLKNHPECSRVHGVDVGCMWEDFMCFATQEIKCNGGKLCE